MSRLVYILTSSVMKKRLETISAHTTSCWFGLVYGF